MLEKRHNLEGARLLLPHTDLEGQYKPRVLLLYVHSKGYMRLTRQKQETHAKEKSMDQSLSVKTLVAVE